MKGWQIALLVAGGVAVVGGAIYFLRSPAKAKGAAQGKQGATTTGQKPNAQYTSFQTVPQYTPGTSNNDQLIASGLNLAGVLGKAAIDRGLFDSTDDTGDDEEAAA